MNGKELKILLQNARIRQYLQIFLITRYDDADELVKINQKKFDDMVKKTNRAL